MSEKNLCFWIRCVIVAIALCGVAICFGWFPFSLSLPQTDTPLSPLRIWMQLVFYWLSALPCFVLLTFAWKISTIMKEKGLFVQQNVTYVKAGAKLLFFDMSVFVLGNVVFLLLGWNVFALLYFFVAIVGMIIALLLNILSHYLFKAVLLQEESEGTI